MPRGFSARIIRHPVLIGFLCISLLLVVIDWPFPKQVAQAVDANTIIFWDDTDGSIPGGWSKVSGAGGAFENKYIRGAGTYGGTGGTATHTHSFSMSGSAGTLGTNITTDARGKQITSPYAHTHSAFSGPSVSTAYNLPSYRNLKVIKYDSGIADTIPNGGIVMFDSDVADLGGEEFEWYTSQNSYMLRGGSSVATGGSDTHTHSYTANRVAATLSSPLTNNTGAVGTASDAGAGHDHTISQVNNTAPTTSLPPYINISFAKATADTSPIDGVIVGFDGTTGVTGTWDIRSDSGDSLYQKFLRASGEPDFVSENGYTSHDHSNGSLITNGPSATTTAPTGATAAATNTHTHTYGTDFTVVSGTDHLPEYIDVVFAEYVPVYTPETRNWRWYADEEDEAVGTPYANENTEPPTIEMGANTRLKLRINISENGGVSEGNSRKKLQYSTDEVGWLEVGGTTDTSREWRYYDGGGSDNQVLSTVVLTDSHSTFKGIHNESNSNSPSNSDHLANTVTEFEYSIEGYDVAAGTGYVFRLYDQVSAAVISPESGKTNPSLTTASSFSLTVSSPSAVFLGTWNYGDGPYHEYIFQGGEELTNRDNRGLDVGGDSNGWTSSVAVSTEMSDGLQTINKGDMYWISEEANVVGLYDAPVTGITGNAGEYMSTSVTVLTVSGNAYDGLGGFTILPTIRIYNSPQVGDYTGGVLTFTTV